MRFIKLVAMIFNESLSMCSLDYRMGIVVQLFEYQICIA